MQSTINLGKKTINQDAKHHEGKYLIFVLCGEEYGIEILKAREIIGIMNITPMPKTSCYIKGVINLRGKVLPVIDLRRKLGFQETDYTKEKCIIVVEIRDRLVGIIVDTVSEVLNIHGEDLQPVPVFGEGVKNTLFLGKTKIKNKVKILLDIDKVLSIEEINEAESLTYVS